MIFSADAKAKKEMKNNAAGAMVGSLKNSKKENLYEMSSVQFSLKLPQVFFYCRLRRWLVIPLKK